MILKINLKLIQSILYIKRQKKVIIEEKDSRKNILILMIRIQVILFQRFRI